MKNSKRMVFSHLNRYMYALGYVFIRGHNKKELKTLRFTVGDLIVYSRMNVTISTWHDWSTWAASEVFGQWSHHSGQTLPLTGHYFEPWIFINQTDLISTSVAAVWQELCISDWKTLNVRGCRRTKLKICGSKYSVLTIFYTVIFVHNKSNSYQTMCK